MTSTMYGEIDRRSAKSRTDIPDLSIEKILEWADAHKNATGHLPFEGSGAVAIEPQESWRAIHHALATGRRGLPGGSSLAQLLTERRGASTLDEEPSQSRAEALKIWEEETFPVRTPKFRRPKRGKRPPLSIAKILEWADAHHKRTGEWPRNHTGVVLDSPFDDTWAAINGALRTGFRCLPGGSTLAQLLTAHRGVRSKHGLPPLEIDQVLEWADAHFEATGAWPGVGSGLIAGAPFAQSWCGVNSALYSGTRGLAGGSSLAKLLAERRDVRPTLSVERILGWADAHQASTGKWPTQKSGPVRAAYRETWQSLDDALRDGERGLPGGTTLARLLAEERGARNMHSWGAVEIDKVLAWADAHHAATGCWPTVNSGPIPDAPGETWSGVESSIYQGWRGQPGGMTLSQLLVKQRGRKPGLSRPELRVAQILEWADAHRAATGRWPTEDSGPVADAPGETWGGISIALQKGGRGLLDGSSLARLLAEHRDARNPKALPRLSLPRILAWADFHHAAHGRWPSCISGPVEAAPGETWSGIHMALAMGHRGLTRGSSLARLLAAHRPVKRPDLTLDRIRIWAEAHRQTTGFWPAATSGPVADAPDEEWPAIESALRQGRRGLPGGSSLRQLFGRSIDPGLAGPRPVLTVEQVTTWANDFHAATGRWPRRTSGAVSGVPGEKWVNIDEALRKGRRGLPQGSGLVAMFPDAEKSC